MPRKSSDEWQRREKRARRAHSTPPEGRPMINEGDLGGAQQMEALSLRMYALSRFAGYAIIRKNPYLIFQDEPGLQSQLIPIAHSVYRIKEDDVRRGWGIQNDQIGNLRVPAERFLAGCMRIAQRAREQPLTKHSARLATELEQQVADIAQKLRNKGISISLPGDSPDRT